MRIFQLLFRVRSAQLTDYIRFGFVVSRIPTISQRYYTIYNDTTISINFINYLLFYYTLKYTHTHACAYIHIYLYIHIYIYKYIYIFGILIHAILLLHITSVHVLYFSEGAAPYPFFKSKKCALPSFKSQNCALPFFRRQKYTLPFFKNE